MCSSLTFYEGSCFRRLEDYCCLIFLLPYRFLSTVAVLILAFIAMVTG